MTHRVVVLGAGYAGLSAAYRCARLLRGTDALVTLVNRDALFVERVRLHQVAAGQSLPGRSLRHLLAGTGIEVVCAEVVGLDPSAREVRLGGTAGVLPYDSLVYALGSGSALAGVPGGVQYGHGLASPAEAHALRGRLAGLPAGAAVVVVGGGLTGLEAATEFAESHLRLRLSLVSNAPVGGWLSPPARGHVVQVLQRLRVDRYEGERALAIDGDGLELAAGRHVPADAVVWAGGFQVPAIAADAGLATDARGRILVDEHLRSVSHREIYAVGDAAIARTQTGAEIRMACQTALPMGRHVAAEIAHGIHGRPWRAFEVRYLWQNISLGRGDAVTQFTHRDDAPARAVLTGAVSARFKELITRGAAWRTTN